LTTRLGERLRPILGDKTLTTTVAIKQLHRSATGLRLDLN